MEKLLPQALQWLTQSLSQPGPPAIQSVGELVAMLRDHAGAAAAGVPLGPASQEGMPDGSVPVLVACLKSPDATVQRLAAAALSWLAGDEQIRTHIAAQGAVPAMMELLNTGSASVQREAALGLRQLAGDQHIRARIVSDGGVPALLDLLEGTDTQTQMLTALALNWIVEDRNVRSSLVGQNGIPKLVRLLRSESAGVQREAAATLTQLAADLEIRPLIAQVHARARARPAAGCAGLRAEGPGR